MIAGKNPLLSNMEVERSENKLKIFRPDQSELERDHEKLGRYVTLLEEAIGHGFKVVGILEIGSFAKGEAVPGSDIDTRVFVISPEAYLWQTASTRYAELERPKEEKEYSAFSAQHADKPHVEYNWHEFNFPVSARVSEVLDSNIEFGLVDTEFAAFELANLDTTPVKEHALMLQSNVLYDPTGYLQTQRAHLSGKIIPSLAAYYEERYLSALPFEIYEHVKPHSADMYKIQKNGQIQWVNRAVRCLRDAVATKTYLATGDFTYKKAGVLAFYEHYVPEEMALVNQLYKWKCDPEIRAQMVAKFVHDPTQFFPEFERLTVRLEEVVKKVKSCLI